MKKILAVMLILCMALCVVACNNGKDAESTDTSADTTAETTAGTTAGTTADTTAGTTAGTTETTGETKVDYAAKSAGVMTYAEYDAAEIDDEVVIEAYVQATQSWWDNKITVYLQDPDGAYFAYELACTEADAAKLTKGTKIKITGYKAAWAGEIEIMDGTFEFVNDGLTWVAEATDVTALLGTEELVKHQNKFVKFEDLTVVSIEYKNGAPGDDIYVKLSKNGAEYSFCVERYLTDPNTAVYAAVGELEAGDVIDVEGFLYWYEGVNTHITAVYASEDAVDYAAKSAGVMTYAEYDAAAMDAEVVIEAYVQATQSWWDNKITVYLQDPDGAYFAYELACTEADAAKLTKGTKIKITGYKAAWAGEIEIMDGTFEFVNDGLTWVAEATDVTALLGTEELVKHQNKFVKFEDLTVVSIEYKNGAPGDDIYVKLSKNGAEYSFCVERYLTDPNTAVYAAVGELEAGDVIDVEGFLYWYENVNTHITAISK